MRDPGSPHPIASESGDFGARKFKADRETAVHPTRGPLRNACYLLKELHIYRERPIAVSLSNCPLSFEAIMIIRPPPVGLRTRLLLGL